MNKTDTIRLAVVGADRRGRISMLAHRPEEGFELVAACSLTPEKLEVYKETCGEQILLTKDYNELLNNPAINAIFICTPDYLHEEHTCAAMEAGKDVFVEKPLAITVEGADRILATAKRTGRKLYVGHNMRFFPVMQKMHELIESGEIGQVQAVWCRHFISYGGDAYYRDWHSERQFTTGLLLQKGAHDIDVIHWLAGGHTQRVVGMGKLSVYDKLPRRTPGEPQPDVAFNNSNWPPKSTGNYSPNIDVEDHSMLLMQLDNGVQASYQQCHYTPDSHRNYTIIGTEGRIENYGDFSSEARWATIHLWNRRTEYSEMGHEVFRIAPMEGSHGGSDPRMINDFLRTLRGECAVGATPYDARMSMATGVLGTQSLREGNTPKDIPPVAVD